MPQSHRPSISYRALAPGGLRDRVDLVIDQRSGELRIGLFDRTHNEIIDIERCPQLTPALQAWLTEFRRLSFAINRGSVRLRVSPAGEKGVWLDFANVDVKMLLDEQTTLRKLLSLGAFVEIGQRRKQLVEKEGLLKLGDPVGRPWFETYIDGKAIPLLTSVGNFTQPGFQINRVLVETVTEFIKTLPGPLKRAVEFGSGVGNFTLPVTAHVHHLDAYEIDALASKHLQTALGAAQLEPKVSIHVGDFQNPSARRTIDFNDVDLVIVDPPRSGLKNFLKPLLEQSQPPRALLYVSCFVESFISDAQQLFDRGYTCSKLTLVDQFPQTPHAELVSLFVHI